MTMIPREAIWRTVFGNPNRNFIIGWSLMAIVLFFIGYAIMAYPTEIPHKPLFRDGASP